MMTGVTILLSLALTQGVPAPPPRPVPVLIVTGANNHDWEWTSASLERILEGSGRFDATVTTDPAGLFASPAAFAPFAAFVLDYNGPRWGEPAERNFLDAVAGGKGVVVVHAANNAFQGWIGYEELVALAWRAGTGHGRFHPFDVRITDRSHPITRTLPDLVAHPDELYHDLVPMHGTRYTVLADALSTKESGGTGEREPMIVVKEVGRGRVFHTPLGHVWRGQPDTRASHEDPQFVELIRRGTEWAATGAVADGTAAANRLETWDEKAGWRLLFDGTTLDGWVAADGWEVVSGALRRPHDAAGDLVSHASFTDVELDLEWMRGAGAGATVTHGEAEHPLGDAPLGRWSRTRLVLRAAAEPHPIGLRGAGEVWFRSIRARDLRELPGREVPLLDTLDHWTQLGDARWTLKDGVVRGESAGGAQSFLVSKEVYADFFLELEVKIDGGNSGVQVRSHVDDAGRLFGVQLEIDRSERAWSGGVYDELRRGWLQGLGHHPLGREAFKRDGWNHYRIECVGSSIRCWVNGVQTADFVDRVDAAGRLGLQVHAGEGTRVAFRGVRVRVLE